MDRKKLIREYREKRPQMGIYALKSGVTKISYIGWAKDLRAALNRHSFWLGTGVHDNKELLGDWNANKDAFEMVTLEILEYSEKNSNRDYTEDLKALLELWTEKIDKVVIL